MIFVSVGRRPARPAGPGQLRRLEGRPDRAGPLDRPRAGLAAAITANVVAPGFIDTDMTARCPTRAATSSSAQIPLGRYAESTRSPPW